MSLSVKRRVLSYLVALCLGVVCVVPAAAAASRKPASTGSVLWGAETGDPWLQFSRLSSFERKAGKKVSLYCFYVSTDTASFPVDQAQAVTARGATPIATIEPWSHRLDDIAAGVHDPRLQAWATSIKTWGKPIWLRFAHEMNGNWYPWGEAVDGNSPGDYVAAFRHVVDVFDAVGATNVTWVWNPNVVYPDSTALAGLYPGDAYVDWVGIDGYNFGTSQAWSTWQSPAAVFGATLGEVRAITAKPIVIAETGSAEAGGSKAKWIGELFALLKANTDVKAFLWFNLNKETDWRIESSSTATAAFATGISDGRYIAP